MASTRSSGLETGAGLDLISAVGHQEAGSWEEFGDQSQQVGKNEWQWLNASSSFWFLFIFVLLSLVFCLNLNEFIWSPWLP